MMKTEPSYSETFMNQAATKTGSGGHGYLTLKLPLVVPPGSIDKLWSVSDSVCFVWNQYTEHQQSGGWLDNYYAIKKLLPQFKSVYQWLRAPSSQVLQEVAKSHAAATTAYRTKKAQPAKIAGRPTVAAKANFPGFKSRKHFHSHKYPQQGVSFEITGKTLRLAYGGSPRDWIIAELPHEIAAASVKAVTVTYDVRHGFSACLETVFELPLLVDKDPVLVFDPGCKTALTGLRSDGTVWEYDLAPLRQINMTIFQKIDNLMSRRDSLPCAQKLAEYRIARKNETRFVGPRQEGYIWANKPVLSRRYHRLAAKITALWSSINNRSKQYLHTVAKQILKDHPMVSNIFVGDWAKQETVAATPFIAKNELINRAVQNNNPIGRLLEYLSYKAQHAAKQVVKFDEKGTTKTCSACDYIGASLPPSQRSFRCPRCGFSAPRDINATLNQMKIVAYGMWHALKAVPVISSVRTSLSGLSCVNLKRLPTLVSLSTGMHRIY